MLLFAFYLRRAVVAQAFLPVWFSSARIQHRQECLCHLKPSSQRTRYRQPNVRLIIVLPMRSCVLYCHAKLTYRAAVLGERYFYIVEQRLTLLPKSDSAT